MARLGQPKQKQLRGHYFACLAVPALRHRLSIGPFHPPRLQGCIPVPSVAFTLKEDYLAIKDLQGGI
jgi:hypothetical protein